MKKLLSVLLVLLMLSANAIADGFNEEGYPIVDEPITVTCMFPRGANQPTDFSNMWLVRQFREKLGINLEFDLVEASAFNERKALALASGEYSDIFFGGITAEDEQMYGGQGIFIDLSELIEKYAPEFTALMKQYPDIRAAVTSEDGKIYSMPVLYTAARDRIANTSWINKGWLKNVGKELPETLDDLYDILCSFRDLDANGNGDPGDELPMTWSNIDDIKRVILAALGVCYYAEGEDDVIDGKYLYIPMSEQYKAYLKYMAKLYSEKLIDPNAFILSAEEYNNLIKENRIGFGDSTWPSYYYVAGDYKENWTHIPMLTSDTFTDKIWPGQQFVFRQTGNFVVTDKCKYPEAMVRMADYCFTTEGSLLVRSGPEDGAWDGEGGWHIVKDEEGNELYSVITYDKDKYTGFYNFREQQSPMSMPYNSSDYMGFVMLAGDEMASWAWGDLVDSRPLENLKINYPLVFPTVEEQDVLNTVLIDLRNYVSSMEIKFITGEVDVDTGWDEYVATLKKMGAEEVIRVKQAGYDRYAAKLEE